MKAMPIRIALVLSIAAILLVPCASHAAERRTALIIGNGAYSSGPLKNPVNDAADMAAALGKMGFSVVLKKNADLQTMEGAVADFGNRLKRGGVGLFYYAGHGLQVNGVNYLIPIGVRIDKESDIKYRAVDAGQILDEMANANNGLNIVLLDACRDNPFARSFRSASRGLAIVSNAPTGTFISYSTGPGQVARDGDSRNSPYTKALLHYMKEPGVPIGDVFMNVRKKLRAETGQVPWELSSLEGKFYFVPRAAGKTAAARAESRPPVAPAGDAPDAKEATAPQSTELAAIAPPAVTNVTETKRDGRFIAYSDGTVLDTKTNLMWAAKDSESTLNWKDAGAYVTAYRGGGHADWRMPGIEELTGLFDRDKLNRHSARVTELIDIHWWIWAAEMRGPEALCLDFGNGLRNSGAPTGPVYINIRALPVRSVK